MEDKNSICRHCENGVEVNDNQTNANDKATSGGNLSNSNANQCNSNGMGGTTVFSTCRRWMVSGRFQDILPKESLTMSLVDWEDLYRRERLAQVHHSVYTSSGCFLQLDQRQLVMSWISDVAHRLAWEKSTFHIATSLIDQYMFCLERDPVSRRRLDRSSLAATFAAAVVTAASLGECLGECHDRKHCPGLPPLHRFVQSSGIIRSSRDIVEMQIQLLVQTSRYGGPSLLNKTPAHMTLHYLSRLKHLVESLLSSLSGVSPPCGATGGPSISQQQKTMDECGGGPAAQSESGVYRMSDQHQRDGFGDACAGLSGNDKGCSKKSGAAAGYSGYGYGNRCQEGGGDGHCPPSSRRKGAGSCLTRKIGISTTVGQAILGIRDKIDYAYLFEKIMFAHELALYSGINLLIPGSRISASILISILTSYDPILQLPTHQNILYNSLCLLDYDIGIRPYMPYLDPLIRRITSMSVETIRSMESNGMQGGASKGGGGGGSGGAGAGGTCTGNRNASGVYKLFTQSNAAPCDEPASGVILIHKHHLIPDKFLNGLRISTLIAMHSRMSQPSIMNPFSISSPNSISVSPHSTFSSTNGSPGSFQCSPIFYPFNGGIASANGSRCYLDEKRASIPQAGCCLVKNMGINSKLGGHILYRGGQLQSNKSCSLDDGTTSTSSGSNGNGGFLPVNDDELAPRAQYDRGDLAGDDIGIKLCHKDGSNGGIHVAGVNENAALCHAQAFNHYFGHHHLHLSNRGGDDYQHLYTTCSTATNSPLLGGGNCHF
ncbi:hypothetical protein FG386_003378 [Cryptosporidium ryanae]|uniref:uncharacterized protein n=1 Tax=Cryptosporidium ryanae TaxID=515981 RepID=UPI00351A053A|nr:hypothetical protein FG386_003378 [Cryptosporidium ryanae]